MKQVSKNEGLKIAALVLGIFSACMTGLFLCSALSILVIFATNNFFPKDRSFDADTKVMIIWSIEDPDMFPESWLSAPNSVRVTALNPDEVERSTRIIKTALYEYPPELFEGILTKVYIVDSMRQYGAGIGGTYANDTIYIVNGGTAIGYTDHFIERAFHEEFSSILFRTYQDHFDLYEWKKINPSDFRYYGSGYEAIRDGRVALDYDPELLSDGFINQYATSEIENDFNSIVSRMMSGEQELWEAFEEYPRIRDKALFVMKFYQEIDPMFTEDYFRSLVRKTQ